MIKRYYINCYGELEKIKNGHIVLYKDIEHLLRKCPKDKCYGFSYNYMCPLCSRSVHKDLFKESKNESSN